MSILKLSSDTISVEIESSAGTCIRIENLQDPWKSNWIDPESSWGFADGFVHQKTYEENGRIVTCSINEREKLEMLLIRSLAGDIYTEEYRITNHHAIDFFLTHDTFGLHFGYNCDLTPRENVLHDTCITKIWCGGANSWLCSSKSDGTTPHLICMLKEGALADHSIDYDCSRVENVSYWRGFFILHPEDTEIAPGDTFVLKFAYAFRNARPDLELIPDLGQKVFPQADKYSLLPGETAHCSAETPSPAENVEILCNGKEIPFRKDGCKIFWDITPDSPGEQLVLIRISGETSVMRLFALEDLETILKRRVEFIVRKQQFHKKGSHADGAYLVYDRKTGRCVSSNTFLDTDGGHERVGMGVTVAREYRMHPTPELRESLEKYRTFVEREIFDVSTKTVFHTLNKDASYVRAYNYPWVADFYYEYYMGTGDIECLRNAAGIMIKFYKISTNSSPGSMPVQIVLALEKAGETELYDQLKKAVIADVDGVIERGKGNYTDFTETSFNGGSFSEKTLRLCEAYLLTGDEKYINAVEPYWNSCLAFTNFQPDYHLWGQDIRYWDLYWFGKMKSYGDTAPQWTISLSSGEFFCMLGKIRNDESLIRKGRLMVLNCMCLFDRTGFASASYLYPYRVSLHYPEGVPLRNFMNPGTHYGKCYDDWANDQDWSLYQIIRLTHDF